MQRQISAYKAEMRSLTARERELDKIFERLYEDNISGKITDERFTKMSVSYNSEQTDIHEKLKNLGNLLDETL